jgi:hypothetical protein
MGLWRHIFGKNVEIRVTKLCDIIKERHMIDFCAFGDDT